MVWGRNNSYDSHRKIEAQQYLGCQGVWQPRVAHTQAASGARRGARSLGGRAQIPGLLACDAGTRRLAGARRGLAGTGRLGAAALHKLAERVKGHVGHELGLGALGVAEESRAENGTNAKT